MTSSSVISLRSSAGMSSSFRFSVLFTHSLVDVYLGVDVDGFIYAPAATMLEA